MLWSPLAMHDPSSRMIIGWVQQWTCNTFSNTVTLHDSQSCSPQITCSECNAQCAWVFERETSAGEWRCTQTRCSRGQEAFARAVSLPEADDHHQARDCALTEARDCAPTEARECALCNRVCAWLHTAEGRGYWRCESCQISNALPSADVTSPSIIPPVPAQSLRIQVFDCHPPAQRILDHTNS